MLKYIIIPFIVIFSVPEIFSQSNSLDSLLFTRINEHRDSIGLNKLSWDTSIYKASKHHAEYLVLLNSEEYQKKHNKYNITSATHYEEVDFENFEEFFDVDERSKRYMGKSYHLCTENAAVVGARKSLTLEILEDEKIVDRIINGWINSPGHKKNMEIESSKLGACSILLYDVAFKSKSGKIYYIKSAVAIFNADYVAKVTIVK